MTESGTPIYTVDPDWGEPIGARLTSPVLVVSLEGWVDAGLGASTAVAELVGTSTTIPVASFDTEALIDQRARRPIAQLVNGITTELTWPSIQVIAGTDGDGADVLYLVGPEPDFRWKSFLAAVVELVQRLGVRMVVGLGAFPAPAPHTRPVRLASTVPPQSADLAGRVGFVQGTLEVPAGVQAALEVALGAVNVPVISLWARVPHYVAAMPFPEAERGADRRALRGERAGLRHHRRAPRRRGVPATSGRADRRQQRARGHGAPARVVDRLRGGQPVRDRHRGAQRRRDRRRARALPPRRRLLTPCERWTPCDPCTPCEPRQP